MKDLLERLRRIELDAAFLATASPADLFDLEAALVVALVEVRRQRGGDRVPYLPGGAR